MLPNQQTRNKSVLLNDFSDVKLSVRFKESKNLFSALLVYDL